MDGAKNRRCSWFIRIAPKEWNSHFVLSSLFRRHSVENRTGIVGGEPRDTCREPVRSSPRFILSLIASDLTPNSRPALNARLRQRYRMQSRQLRRAAERQALKQARKNQTTPVPEPASRAETNRANSQHSTGPVTPAGKAASSRNSFKHGLYSKALIYPGENPAELDALKADLRAEHQPANTTEEILVNEMAEQFWRIRRWREREARLMALETTPAGVVAFTEMLPIMQRLMSAAERGFHKSLATLRQLQKDRGFVPHFFENAATAEESEEEIQAAATAASGFVPQSDTPSNPKPANAPPEPEPTGPNPLKMPLSHPTAMASFPNHG